MLLAFNQRPLEEPGTMQLKNSSVESVDLEPALFGAPQLRRIAEAVTGKDGAQLDVGIGI